jgi:hypothetical protein
MSPRQGWLLKKPWVMSSLPDTVKTSRHDISDDAMAHLSDAELTKSRDNWWALRIQRQEIQAYSLENSDGRCTKKKKKERKDYLARVLVDVDTYMLWVVTNWFVTEKCNSLLSRLRGLYVEAHVDYSRSQAAGLVYVCVEDCSWIIPMQV